jgi:3-hydroxybutyryl-CoA dehydrogenase
MSKKNGPVAVIGAGTMGHGIAQIVAQNGMHVRLTDASDDALVWAESKIQLSLDKAVARGVLTRERRDETIARIRMTTDVDDAVADAQLVIEAVPEDAEIKRTVFEHIDRVAPDDAILATNTSAMSITLIASWTKHPERVLGLHFFNPVDRMPLVEIVRGLTTDERTIERGRALVERIDKESIIVADRPGFATSRLSAAIGNEAWYMFMEGVAPPEDIDRAVKLALGFPMGPFELGDLIGLDIRLSVLRTLHATLGERFRPCPLLIEYVDAGYLGRKTGRGVYEYHDGRETRDA